MKGKLKNGFEYEVNDNILDNWEFVKLCRKIQKDSLCAVDFLDMALGEEQEEALCESLRGKDGIVHTSDVASAIEQISTAINESGTAGKN